jgi:lipid-binding SYLF domain-containing protein
LLLEQLQRTAGFEVCGYRLTEIDGSRAGRSFSKDMSDLVAVGRDDHGVQVPQVIDEMTIGAERELAASAKGVENGAFGADSIGGGGAVQCAYGGVDGGVAGTSLRG